MKSLYSIIFLIFPIYLFAQTSPRFQKYPVLDSGFKLYLPCKPDPIDLSYSLDSSKVYTVESIDSSSGSYFHFGAILVTDLAIAEQEEEMTIAYLDYLKDAFHIRSSAGYGKGHTLSTHASAKGILDYWKDKDGDEWIVKAWADSESIVVMFIYGPSSYENTNITDLFFSGIRFPAD